MDQTIKLLGGLLAVQLLLALWAFSGGSDLSVQRPEEPLLTFDAASVTAIKIEGSDGATITLSRSDQGWILPDAWNVPAKESKVEQLLQRLQNLKKGLAVATTSGAQARFEVAGDKFQRRITLSRGDDALSALYLGTAPGMRKIHARTADDGIVYSISFAAYEAAAKADDWLDSGLLRIAVSELDAIELDGFALTKLKGQGNAKDGAKIDQGWEASGLADNEQLDQSKVRELARKITQLDVRKVLGTDAKTEYRQDSPELKLTLKRTEGQPVIWTLSKPEKGEDYVLNSSEHPWYFEVASRGAKPLLEVAERDALIISPEPVDEAKVSEMPEGEDSRQNTPTTAGDGQGTE